MLRSKTTTGLSVILAAAFILAACQQATPVAPTMDANAIYTQAAATVAAGLAQTQASQPSSTPAPATATPTGTATQALNATVAQPGPGGGTCLRIQFERDLVGGGFHGILPAARCRLSDCRWDPWFCSYCTPAQSEIR